MPHEALFTDDRRCFTRVPRCEVSTGKNDIEKGEGPHGGWNAIVVEMGTSGEEGEV